MYMMPIQDANFIWKIYWTIPWKTMGLSFLVKLIITKEGRLVCDTTFSYTYSKRTKQAIWTPRLLALKTKKKKLEKPTILVCLIYHTGTEEWDGTVMERKMELSPL
jgi:hypothetical protein